jgi:hypothetical protein
MLIGVGTPAKAAGVGKGRQITTVPYRSRGITTPNPVTYQNKQSTRSASDLIASGSRRNGASRSFGKAVLFCQFHAVDKRGNEDYDPNLSQSY